MPRVRRPRRQAPVLALLHATLPELRRGLTESAARRQHGDDVATSRFALSDSDRAQTEREAHGHIKVVVDKKGKILGVTIVGAQAGELIATWILSIAQGMNIRALTGVVLPYPTLSEIGKRAAIDFFTPSLTRPLLRRIIAWLRIFG